MDDWTKIGKSCVRAAMDELRMLTDVTALNNERNIKTSADMAAHNAVIAALEKSGVSCVLHSEEAADPIAINGGSGEVHVMLDPVDGSVFFLRGELSFCAVGILVLIGGKPGFAFVGDIAAGDIYHCDKKGAYKDGVP
ncbi:MAG: hypothetical protein NTX14_00920, partial [Candidatus Nealsonbacteria bacterium]|nr:hypothetical protein [Candidatus Nealsonbacteria bacterium]